MSRKQRKGDRPAKDISTAEYLAACVYRNEAMEVEELRSGRCRVAVPLKRPRWLVPPLTWILPFSSHRRVELDELGSEVLRLCDGRRSVEEIIEKFASSHKLTFREAQVSVTTFLKQLTQRGIIVIVGQD